MRFGLVQKNGFAIIYNSASTFEADPGDYNAQRIKLEFEGNVEFLLGSTFISDIEIDGGNRNGLQPLALACIACHQMD